MPTAVQTVSAFPAVFMGLKEILHPYEKKLKVLENTPTRYTLGGTIFSTKRRESMLMAVYSMKSYVSIHLMPIYMCPETAERLSPDLRKHKQGKACFNFSEYDPKLFLEVATLVKRSIAACKAKKLF